MSTAYIILSHRFPEQLVRLVNALDPEHNHFFIHIDRRADEMYRRCSDELSHLPNVRFIQRFTCHWGHFNLMRATLEALKTAVQSQAPFEHIVLLSGQDYPIKSTQAIEQFFQDNLGKQFINYYSVDEPSNPWAGMPFPCNAVTRTHYWHFVFRSRLLMHLPIKRRLPLGYEPYLGSQWWALSKDCAEYVVQFVAQNPKFVNFFKNAYVPDEIFFQSVVLNSPFKDTAINRVLTFMDWHNPNPNVPATLLEGDFHRLADAPDLFARKFDQSRDSKILDLIDQNILSKEKTPVHSTEPQNH